MKFDKQNIADLSFTSGVLIHLNPDYLNLAYEALYNSSKKYILVCEYYNPSPVELSYRGHREKLFKKRFCWGYILSKYSDLELVNYGFRYHKDNNLPLDDITWFLMKKKIIFKGSILMKAAFKNKSILITGGTGSFGNRCIGVLLKKYRPKKM